MTDPTAPQTPRDAAQDEPKKSGGWCSMLLVIVLGFVALVVVVGASIGFALMGGVADPPFNTLPPPSSTITSTLAPATPPATPAASP
jgi:hypothetical protein